MNFTGMISALVVFLGIWSGHVAVRKIEFFVNRLWLPAAFLFLSSLSLIYSSLSSASRQWSAALGILGTIVLWDVIELFRQQKRVQIGHAPANPSNPRHQWILAHYPSSTTENPFLQ